MTQVTVKDLACRLVTPELAEWLRSIGEKPECLNVMTWPSGASSHGVARLFMHEAEAKKLLDGDRTAPVEVVFQDDNVSGLVADKGKVTAAQMFQIAHRPLHQWKDAAQGVGESLWEVTLVDERYFWKFKNTSSNTNVTTPRDRTILYESTEFTPGTPRTWGDLIQELLSDLGVLLETALPNIAEADTPVPTDFLMFDEPAADMLDRVCASLGLVFVAFWDTAIAGGDRYKIGPPSDFNITEATRRSEDHLGGGPSEEDPDTEEGRKWLDATMPAQVLVLFPRSETESRPAGKTEADAPVLTQLAGFTSIVGKPTGVTGRTGTEVVIHDNTWAIGSPGSETNAADLQKRTDFLAKSYYARFKMNHAFVRLRGFRSSGPVVGDVEWRLTPSGPFTIYRMPEEWHGFGGDRDVVDGFTRKRIVGVGGIQVIKTYSGGLLLAGTSPKAEVVVAMLTGRDGSVLYRFSWVEVEVALDGTVTVIPGGRSGTTTVEPAIELEKNPLTVVFPDVTDGDVVVLHKTIDDEGVITWVFTPGYAMPFTAFVLNDGGVAGDKDTDCTFTYEVRTFDNITIATFKTPTRPRHPKITYIAAPDFSVGYIGWFGRTGGGGLNLDWAIEEIEDLTLCNTP